MPRFARIRQALTCLRALTRAVSHDYIGPMPHIDLLEMPYFEGIDIGDLVSLIDAMVPRQFAAGEHIITQGDAQVPPLYIVTKGLIDIVQQSPGGAPCLLAQHQGPTLIGEVELFLARSPSNTVKAITQVSAFVLEREVFAALRAKNHPALGPFLFHVAQVACDRLVHSDHMVVQALGHAHEPALAPKAHSS
jgi:CRP-like cAMP-binding protein